MFAIGIQYLVLPGIIWYVLGQVGQKYCHIKADVFSRIVESVRELVEVHFSILVSIHTHHDVFDLFSVANKERTVIIRWILTHKFT